VRNVGEICPKNIIMIAVCTKCRLIFDSPGISIVDSQSVSLHNNYTKCPKCNSKARFLDGTFNFDENGIASVLSAPQFTTEILTQIKSLLEQVQEKQITTEEFHKKVETLPPLIRKIINLIIPKESSGFWAMVGVLYMVINSLQGPDTHEIQTKRIEANPSAIEEIVKSKRDTTLLKKKNVDLNSDSLTLNNE